MTCMDCLHWRSPVGKDRHTRVGWCQRDRRSAHANYQCSNWTLRTITHRDVGLTPAEVSWARANPHDRHVTVLSTLFRRIQAQPRDDSLRHQFDLRLEEWRKLRAKNGVKLSDVR